MIISVIAYVLYHYVFKLMKSSRVMNGFLSIVIATSAVFLTMYMIDKNDVTNDIYLIPSGYEGNVFAFYHVHGAPKVEKEDGFELHDINDKESL